MFTGNNRIQELYEVSELAAKEGRFDIVEQCYMEIEELRNDIPAIVVPKPTGKLYPMQNDYIKNTPVSQLISDRITCLIQDYGFDMVFGPRRDMESMLIIHLNNLKNTYGSSKLKEVGQWFKA